MKYSKVSLIAFAIILIGMLPSSKIFAAASDTLFVTTSSGVPGTGGHTFSINCSNTDTLKGFFFTLVDVPDSLKVTGVATTTRSANYRVDTTSVNGSFKVLMFPNNSSARVMPGTGSILDITVDVDANAEGGTKAELSLTNVAVADSVNGAVTVSLQAGYFWFGKKGDVVYNGQVDLFDVLRMIDIAIARPPSPTEYELWAGDFDEDGAVDIQDIGQAIDSAVAAPMVMPDPGQQNQMETSGTARFEISQLPTNQIGQLTLPVRVKTSVPIFGVQMVFHIDNANVKVGQPVLRDQARSMTLKSKFSGNKLYVLVTSPQGKTIPAGEHEILNLPINILVPVENSKSVDLEQVVAGTRGAARIESIYDSHNAEEAVVPESFALFQNNPNPFNMTTNIIYDIPATGEGAVQVKLQIFNTQGQLVRTLENGQRSAGRYTVQWDGTDDFGRTVSSGVYFYKLIAGDVVLNKKLAVMK